MSTVANTRPSSPLHVARHLVGMGMVALLNPLIYKGQAGIYSWIVPPLVALLMSTVATGLYALFFTTRAKSNWPRVFFVIAWALLLVQVTSSLLTYNQRDRLEKIGRASNTQQAVQPTGQDNPFRDPNYGKDLLQKPPNPSELEFDPSRAAPVITPTPDQSLDRNGKPCTEITEFLGDCKRHK